jgi:acetyl esterase/lipase
LCVAQQRERPPKPSPDLADVAYGPHERNVLDLWQAKSDSPTPLVVYIHGGGFRGGDKRSIRPELLVPAVKAGFSVAAINYRLSHQASYPAFMHDSARAIQYIRSRAAEWNLNPALMAATGGSAGAGISLWIGFHEDMADRSSPDPVRRQSTRLTAMGVLGAQTSYDPRVITRLISRTAALHPALAPFYGLTYAEYKAGNYGEQTLKQFKDASPITHLSAGDPPVFMYFTEANEPIPPDAKPGQGIHHPRFGAFLKKRMDSFGIECEIHHRDEYESNAQRRMYLQMLAFFKRHFGGQ